MYILFIITKNQGYSIKMRLPNQIKNMLVYSTKTVQIHFFKPTTGNICNMAANTMYFNYYIS